MKNFKGGTALFSAPNTPIKCGGAPQKIMYLASDYWRKHGVLDKANVRLTSGGSVIFGVKSFADALQKVVNRYGIKTDFLHNLKEIRGEQQEAVYDVYKDGQVVGEETLKFDLLHVVPPMSAPDFIKNSPLAVPGNPWAGSTWTSTRCSTCATPTSSAWATPPPRPMPKPGRPCASRYPWWSKTCCRC
ncbi:hypothetical protein ACFQT0_30585 [Hymenobacter humi]|uniref:Amine oxidase domain-containing protein n=1 Tax=Hymenobacter humi TaxID=1411620 RepID=A0ABW2UCV4_9BACT